MTVYKTAPKYIIDNEYYWLTELKDTGYVPAPVERPGLEVISMPFIENEPVTDPEEFMSHLGPALNALKEHGCRHGDLTKYSVLVQKNKPVIIDFGEARIWDSPIQDKRPEGDSYWLKITMRKLAYGDG